MDYINFEGEVVEKPEDELAAWRPSVYGVYVKDAQVLMCRSRLHDVYEFPGGGVEDGESFESTLDREFLEETGSKIVERSEKPDYFLHRNSKFLNNKFYQTLLFWYEIKKVEEVPGAEFGENEDIIENVWVSFGENMDKIHIAHKEAFKYFSQKYS